MIRQKVMKNFFAEAAQQEKAKTNATTTSKNEQSPDPPVTGGTSSAINSASTVQAKTKLQSRFRLTKSGETTTGGAKTNAKPKPKKSKGVQVVVARKPESKKTPGKTAHVFAAKKEEDASPSTCSSLLSLSPKESKNSRRSWSRGNSSECTTDDGMGWEEDISASPFSLDAHKMDPFESWPVSNISKLELLFQLCKISNLSV